MSVYGSTYFNGRLSNQSLFSYEEDYLSQLRKKHSNAFKRLNNDNNTCHHILGYCLNAKNISTIHCWEFIRQFHFDDVNNYPLLSLSRYPLWREKFNCFFAINTAVTSPNQMTCNISFLIEIKITLIAEIKSINKVWAKTKYDYRFFLEDILKLN